MSVDRFYLHKDGKEMYNSSDLKKNWKEGGLSNVVSFFKYNNNGRLSIVFYLNKNGKKKEGLSIVFI